MSALRYGWTTDDHEGFWLGFSRATREPGTWREELYAAARAVANRATALNRPLWVCASGGIDSEIACRAFYDQGIDFSVLTLEHSHGTNSHDIKYARMWCQERGVRQKIVPFDVEVFLNVEVDRYAESYPAIHPFRYLQIRLLELVAAEGGFAVLCSGEQSYQTHKIVGRQLMPGDVYLPLSSGNCIADEWCRRHGVDHEAFFHFSTPELCLSYLRHPLVSFALTHPETVFTHPVNTYTFKRLVYLAVWNDVKPRYKWHGFENMRPAYEAAKRRLRERHMGRYVPVDLSVDAFRAQLEGRQSPEPKTL